jgi:hypothetical protein
MGQKKTLSILPWPLVSSLHWQKPSGLLVWLKHLKERGLSPCSPQMMRLFAKVPAEALNALLADKTKLAKVLTYHVVSGEVLAKKVVKLKSAKTLEGSSVAIKEADGKVMIGDANVTATDIKCSNGVIHVIDKVLMPQ